MTDEYERDPEQFGDLWAKPNTITLCRVFSVGPHPSVTDAPGFHAVLSIDMATPDQRFEMCIDERSARFLAGAIDLYLKPFHSDGDGGTPSADALKPSI
jgi:hypothetical protein